MIDSDLLDLMRAEVERPLKGKPSRISIGYDAGKALWAEAGLDLKDYDEWWNRHSIKEEE